jgi:hypothetical protein
MDTTIAPMTPTPTDTGTDTRTAMHTAAIGGTCTATGGTATGRSDEIVPQNDEPYLARSQTRSKIRIRALAEVSERRLFVHASDCELLLRR